LFIKNGPAAGLSSGKIQIQRISLVQGLRKPSRAINPDNYKSCPNDYKFCPQSADMAGRIAGNSEKLAEQSRYQPYTGDNRRQDCQHHPIGAGEAASDNAKLF
jgi:hypothetical protein